MGDSVVWQFSCRRKLFTRWEKGETFMRNLTIGLMAVLCVLWTGAGWADGKDDHDKHHSAKAKDIFQLEFTARNTRDGAIILGRIVYDISVPDSNSDPTVGLYEGAILRFSTKIINAENNAAEFVTQTLTFSAGGTVLVGLPGDGVGHCGPSIVCLNFISPPGASSELVTFSFPAGSLTTDALPTAVPRNADLLLLELNDGRSQFSSVDTKVSVKRLRFFRDDERDDEEDRHNRG